MAELLPSDLVDRTPEGDREIDLKRGLVIRQSRQLAPCEASVTCPCGRPILVRYAYQCFFCAIWFCQGCARRHFRTSNHGPFGGGVP